jgi:predicted nucleic acid-binding protein
MIFVDTGAWYALAVPSDPDHDQAKACIEASAAPLVTSDFVIDELLTLFVVRGRKSAGVQWLHDVLHQGAVRIVRVTEEDFAAALRIYEQFADKAWSFTDCTTYAVMKRLGVETAFSFDQHFRQFGTVAVLP